MATCFSEKEPGNFFETANGREGTRMGEGTRIFTEGSKAMKGEKEGVERYFANGGAIGVGEKRWLFP
jgi:hypothetical protein